MQENGVDEVSDVFLDFGGQQFIESSCSKPIYEHLYKSIIVLWQSECEMNIDIDVSIVLGWAFLNWGVVVDDVLGEEADNSLVAAIAPVSTGCHEWQ